MKIQKILVGGLSFLTGAAITKTVTEKTDNEVVGLAAGTATFEVVNIIGDIAVNTAKVYLHKLTEPKRMDDFDDEFDNFDGFDDDLDADETVRTDISNDYSEDESEENKQSVEREEVNAADSTDTDSESKETTISKDSSTEPNSTESNDEVTPEKSEDESEPAQQFYHDVKTTEHDGSSNNASGKTANIFKQNRQNSGKPHKS